MSELSQSIQDDIRDAEPGWCNAFVECGECPNQWVATFPVECAVADLECPACGASGLTEAIVARAFKSGDKVRVTNGDYHGMRGVVTGEDEMFSEAARPVYRVDVDVYEGRDFSHTASATLAESELEALEEA